MRRVYVTMGLALMATLVAASAHAADPCQHEHAAILRVLDAANAQIRAFNASCGNTNSKACNHKRTAMNHLRSRGEAARLAHIDRCKCVLTRPPTVGRAPRVKFPTVRRRKPSTTRTLVANKREVQRALRRLIKQIETDRQTQRELLGRLKGAAMRTLVRGVTLGMAHSLRALGKDTEERMGAMRDRIHWARVLRARGRPAMYRELNRLAAFKRSIERAGFGLKANAVRGVAKTDDDTERALRAVELAGREVLNNPWGRKLAVATPVGRYGLAFVDTAYDATDTVIALRDLARRQLDGDQRLAASKKLIQQMHRISSTTR